MRGMSIPLVLLLLSLAKSEGLSDENKVVVGDSNYYNYYESSNNKNLSLNKDKMMSRQCFQCQSLTVGDACFNVSQEQLHLSQMCPQDHTHCSTQSVRYYLSTRSHQPSPSSDAFSPWSVNRTCATSECKDFCVVMGARTKLVFCNSCCNEDNCNVHNDANIGYSFIGPPALVLIHGAFTALFQIFK